MPRRADGTWEDANGNIIFRSNPNDSAVDRTKATFKDGFWYDNATGQKIPDKSGLPQRVPGTKVSDPGSIVWPDGTPVDKRTLDEINNQANGNPPSPGAPNYGATGFADPSNTTANWLRPDAPGAELPTAQADADRQRMQAYLEQLQNQAQTGSGAWEGQLANATRQGVDASTALGQSAAGIDAMTARRNIENAGAGVQQRAAGQAETLRAQTQQQAQNQLADIYSAQGSLDAQQAAEQAAARQGYREANAAVTDKANAVNSGIYSGAAQGLATVAAMGASDGGTVPGHPKVFGDDEKNDTVPAMLSPGEIVLPRSVTLSAHPEADAAAFVRAVKERDGVHHFDDGGQVPWTMAGKVQDLQNRSKAPGPGVLDTRGKPGDMPENAYQPWATKPDTNASDALPVLSNDSSVTGVASGLPWMIPNEQQAASVRNGGLLDTTAYGTSRANTLNSTQAFLDAFGGNGPSIVPQQTRAATDENIAAAMGAQAGARGAGRGAAAGLIGGRASQEQTGVTGQAGSTAAQEAALGGQSYAAAIQRQRQMDLAFAMAQQQAAWRNSMLNSDIGLSAQANMRGVLGGVGQAFAAGASAFDDHDWSAGGDSASAKSGSSKYSGADWGATEAPAWSYDTDLGYANGGEIRRYADGGFVDSLRGGIPAALQILSGPGGPWAGARKTAGQVGDEMAAKLEDEAILRARPAAGYSPKEAFDIETTNPLKVAAMEREGMRAAPMSGALKEAAVPLTVLQGVVAKLKSKMPIAYGTTREAPFISDVADQLAREGYELTKPELDALMLEANRSGAVNLRRKDLVTKEARPKMEKGEVRGAANSTFHLVDVPEGFADGGEVDGLDAGTELSGPREAGALQAPPFAAPVRPPGPMPVAAPLAPPPAGLPMARPQATQAKAPARVAQPSPFDLEQQAISAETSANEELGRARAEALIGAQKAMEQASIRQQETQARARMQADADMARILDARQQMANMSSTVDPGRWWASRSTPGKIAAAIGLALGAIGAGNDGVNRAVGIIENAIGRDLEAQKAEHTIRMRQGQMAFESATSIYGLHRQLAADDIGATDAAKATAMELAKNQIDLATARASSPLAKAQGQAASAQIAQKRDAFDSAARQHAFDNRIKLEDSETRRIAALKEGASQRGRDFVAPGYKLMEGAAPKVEELGKWRDALAEKKNADASIQKLKSLIDKSSFRPFGSDAAEAQSLISDLKVSYKNMATLGALSGSDYKLIDDAIPDPTSFAGHVTPDKTLKSRLDQFAKTADTKIHNKASVLGIVKDEESGGADQTGAALEWLRANPDSPKAPKVRARLQAMGAM